MTWNFDMSSIPRGHRETRYRIRNGEPQAYYEFVPDHIWIETVHGEVIKTYFTEKRGHNGGHWLNIPSEDRIICWQPFVRPAATGLGKRIEPISATDRHHAAADLAQIMTGIPGSEFLINDVGGE